MEDTGVVESHPDACGIHDEGGRRELREGDGFTDDTLRDWIDLDQRRGPVWIGLVHGLG